MVRLYRPQDYSQIESWCSHLGVTPPSQEELPKVGFIADDLAAGFLLQTDTSVAFIGSYLANLRGDRTKRGQALDQITQELFKKAKELGFKMVRCETKNTYVRARALRHGFSDIGSFMTFIRKL